MSKRWLYGALLCLIACISWGAMFPVAHHSFKYIDPFYFTVFRYVPVVMILVVLLWLREGKKAFKTDGRGISLWAFGTAAFTVYNLLMFWGQDALGGSGVLMASVMEALMPMISIMIFWVFRGKRPSIATLGCVIVAFIGVLLVITKGHALGLLFSGNQMIPVLALFLAVVGWVVYTMGGSSFDGWSALRYSALSCLYGMITTVVIVFTATALGWVEAPTVAAVYAIKWDLLFMIIFPGVVALLGWNIGVSILKPVNGLLFINFVPITTLAITYLQGAALTIYDIVGVILVVIALTSNVVLQRWKITVRVKLEARARLNQHA